MVPDLYQSEKIIVQTHIIKENVSQPKQLLTTNHQQPNENEMESVTYTLMKCL